MPPQLRYPPVIPPLPPGTKKTLNRVFPLDRSDVVLDDFETGRTFFQIPTSALFVRPDSVRLTFTFTNRSTVDGDPLREARDVSLWGTNLISRLRISQAGRVLEDIVFHNRLSAMEGLFESANYIITTGASQNGTGLIPEAGSSIVAATASRQYAVPLESMLLHNLAQSLPLGQCQAPLDIMIEWEQPNVALYLQEENEDENPINGYAISNAQLVFDSISLNAMWTSQFKQATIQSPLLLIGRTWVCFSQTIAANVRAQQLILPVRDNLYSTIHVMVTAAAQLPAQSSIQTTVRNELFSYGYQVGREFYPQAPITFETTVNNGRAFSDAFNQLLNAMGNCNDTVRKNTIFTWDNYCHLNGIPGTALKFAFAFDWAALAGEQGEWGNNPYPLKDVPNQLTCNLVFSGDPVDATCYSFCLVQSICRLDASGNLIRE